MESRFFIRNACSHPRLPESVETLIFQRIFSEGDLHRSLVTFTARFKRMQTLTKGLILSLGIAVCLAGSPAFAQKYELHPYAGGMFMTDYQKVLDFKNPGIFG